MELVVGVVEVCFEAVAQDFLVLSLLDLYCLKTLLVQDSVFPQP